MHDLSPSPEKVLLVGVALKSAHSRALDTSLDELALLAESADCVVVGIMRQRLEKITPSTYIGSGKVEQIAKLKDEVAAQLVIIDAKLSGIQQRNLQELIGCKVFDRHQLILHIFGLRARTHEGKLQVELAQLKDQLPRLIGEAVAGLSRQAGGIGTRGPGETKLEMDRRRVKTRIEQVTKELESVRQSRDLHRKRRQASHIPVIALTGYTNSGKSTLLNKLTRSDVYVENKFFATLDPTTRKLRLPSGKMVVMTDTVGFISNLPHLLVEAFKATFEEIATADIILHVHDASHPFENEQSKTVSDLLKEIGVVNKPVLHAYNKIDCNKSLDETSEPQHNNPYHSTSFRETPFVNVSALIGTSLDRLLESIDHILLELTKSVDLYLPASEPALVFNLARDGKILIQEEGPNIIHCRVELSEEALQRWSRFLVT
jgi:GTP-binding protein HflX